MNGLRGLAVAAVGMSLASLAMANVQLASAFSDHMVLQRNTEVAVWGSGATPGHAVAVYGSWGASVKTKADKDGKFKVKIKTGKAGGPYLLTVRAQDSKVYGDVMLGEVWVCSGQSNMEWPVGSMKWPTPIVNAQAEVDAANHPDLRLFHVPNKHSLTPQTEVDAQWNACSPETVMNFSATAYFFGRDLQRALKVPVGLIMTCVGGTEAELWTSEEKLRKMPDFAASLSRAAKSQADYQAKVAKVNEENAHLDPGWGKWHQLAVDPAGWDATTPERFSQTGLNDFDGVVWYRATFAVQEDQVGKAATLTLGPIDDNDITWVNGTKVGATNQWDAPRTYQVPAGVLKAGQNVLAVRVHDTGGEGGFTDNTKIALKSGDFSATFTDWYRRVSVKQADLKPGPNPPGNYSTLYNGMVAPIIPYTIKGAIWYQGESNVGRAYQYRTLFPAMIQDWRMRWGQGNFPFLFVQIAPFSGYGSSGASADLREAQLMTLSNTPNTGMIVTSDITPNLADIHPPRKQEVGLRLADTALREAYGRKLVASGPLYKSAEFKGNQAVVTFAFNQGLNGSLEGFEVAGKDKVWHAATAKVVGGKVVVTSDAVALPVAVRYQWNDVPKATLFNSTGRPASSFRSDNWERVTQKAKW
ncbi:MAG: beta galactosidase jelly roll domain-containing protein [Armatimonadetes bacterium]|nr:beta galactosidase jelly roll domain-containing protein [Armatimonadota bacterium]